ncbi:MAG: hypothetical protein AAF035_15145 [Pseudomonadota bacterium]
MSDATVSRLMEREEMEARPHGFRATFRTWVEETTETPFEVKVTALGFISIPPWIRSSNPKAIGYIRGVLNNSSNTERVEAAQITREALFLFGVFVAFAWLLVAANAATLSLVRFKTLFHFVVGPPPAPYWDP